MYSFTYVVFILCILIFHDSLYFVTKCDWQFDNKRFIIIIIIIIIRDNFTNFADSLRSCRRILVKFFCNCNSISDGYKLPWPRYASILSPLLVSKAIHHCNVRYRATQNELGQCVPITQFLAYGICWRISTSFCPALSINSIFINWTQIGATWSRRFRRGQPSNVLVYVGPPCIRLLCIRTPIQKLWSFSD